MSKGKRKSFSEQHTQNFVERLEAKNRSSYKKYGHVNGRKYYRIVKKMEAEDVADAIQIQTMYGSYHVPIPAALLNALSNITITEDFRWLKPKQVTLLLLQGKELHQCDPWDNND